MTIAFLDPYLSYRSQVSLGNVLETREHAKIWLANSGKTNQVGLANVHQAMQRNNKPRSRAHY